MNFEELKLVWDTQNKEPLFSVNQEVIHRQVQNDNRSLVKGQTLCEIFYFMIMLGTGTALTIDAVLEGNTRYQYVMAAIFAYIGLTCIHEMVKRKRASRDFDDSLLGDIDRSIANCRQSIRRMRAYIWWAIMPLLFVQLLAMIFNPKPFLWYVHIIMPLSLLWGYWTVLNGIRKTYEPKQRSLESLRDKLLSKAGT